MSFHMVSEYKSIQNIILFILCLLLLYQFILLLNEIYNKNYAMFSTISILDPKNDNNSYVYHLTDIEPVIITPNNTSNTLKYQINVSNSRG